MTTSTRPQTATRPKVLIVGGPDVHLRIDLMQALATEFKLAAAGSDSNLAEQFAEARFPFFYYPLQRGSSPAADLYSMVVLYWLFRQRRPDIVHTFATKPSVWGRLAARSAGIPVVIGTLPGLGSLYASRSPSTRILRTLVYQPLQRAACGRSDLTVFQNHSDIGQFVSDGVVPSERAVVIAGSGVRTDIYDRNRFSDEDRARARIEIGISPESFVVTMVTRVIRSKGVLEFGKAADLLRERYPNLRFLLVGPNDRESRDRLDPAELERLSRSVRWVGPRDDIPVILASSDCFVLPSFYREGIPRSLLEAASTGLPLVATQAPGCDEVVRDGINGSLVPHRDPDALAAAIEKLMVNPGLRVRFARASRALALERFDLSVVARATAQAYWRFLRSGIATPSDPATFKIAFDPRDAPQLATTTR